ncbi:MAG: ribokinase [Nocardioidaceae bacterium]
MTARVVVVGSLNIDLVVGVERHPGPGETVLGGELTRLPGGKGANQALAAARAGAAVHLVGRVGDDADGQTYLAGLAGSGVDVTHVRQTPDATTGTALITVADSGENTIVVAPGANGWVRPSDVDDADGTIRAADVLLVQLELPMDTVVRAVEVARRAGVRAVVNASPVRDVPGALLDAADPVIVNEPEARALGLSDACVTLGARGARWGGRRADPPPVEVVDTTGAGDVFAGTLAARLAEGRTAGEALWSAVDASAAATTWRGAQGWQLR